jgi:hypothetical protein
VFAAGEFSNGVWGIYVPTVSSHMTTTPDHNETGQRPIRADDEAVNDPGQRQ